LYTKNSIKNTYLFGTIFRQVTSGLGIMLGMVMALLGGCWYPLEMFPQVVQKVVKILPTSWAMQGLLDIVSRGKGLVEILPTAGVLMGFAVVFFIIGIVRFRYE
jgi:ABC-2 type transport system permease protein